MARLIYSSFVWLLWLAALSGCDSSNRTAQQKPLQFNQAIRPLLNKHCLPCHGGVSKQGGLSYIYRDQALARGNSGRRNIVPGNAEASEFYQRITTSDPNRRMPYKRPALSKEEIALLKRWIDEGAEWQRHWAFIPPQATTPPTAEASDWPTSAIDQFVLHKMQQQGLQPNPAATAAQWLRRVSLDLTGLPPSENQVSAFLADNNSEKYPKYVDQLLASPAFGERWASVWLDIARYSDSRGYERDRHRDAWPYRDWVVNAFNRNMPYNTFVTKQLAGDLLPNPNMDDFIATAFHRLTAANDEAGTDDEEYRTYAVMDRNATTWSAINGITMNCVQCHSHPYDPIEFEEYYHSLAFFNSSEDSDRRSDGPSLKVAYNSEHNQQLFAWQQQLSHKRAAFFQQIDTWHQQHKWYPIKIETAHSDTQLAKRQLAKLNGLTLDKHTRNKTLACVKNQTTAPKKAVNHREHCDEKYRQQQQQQLQQLQQQKYHNYQQLNKRDQQQTSSENNLQPLTVFEGELRESKLDIPAVATYQLQTAAWQNIDNNGPPQKIGAIEFIVEPLNVQAAKHSPQDGFTIEGIHIEQLRKDGSRQPIDIAYFAPSSVYGLETMLRLQAKRQYDQVNLAANWSTGLTAQLLSHKVASTAILAQPLTLQAGDRLHISVSQLQRDHSRGEKPYYLRHLKIRYSNTLPLADIGKTLQAQRQLTEKINAVAGAQLPIMREQLKRERRHTLLFHRGNFSDKKGGDIQPATPAVFGNQTFTNSPPRLSRLQLAEWFFSDDHALTARVAVNRFWHELFGRGLVTTLGDFGSIGARPSHPELLDWLARHFQRQLRWDIKALLKTLVLSSTYRQNATASADKRRKDPDNQWLSRGPRQRLSAEMVRDQALMAAGLLSAKRGGVSVMPPQPEGIWQTVYNRQRWVTASGEDRYRRAIYTYSKRTSPYPSFITFDDAGHTVSAVQRFPTNTPLQALVTLNDPVYHEAAISLAQKMRNTAQSKGTAAGINRGFIRLLSREASQTEQRILGQALHRARQIDGSERSESAAWQDIASILLNMDASLNR